MRVEVVAIDRIEELSAPQGGAVYAVRLLVDGRPHTIRTSIRPSTPDGQPAHELRWRDEQDRRMFWYHPGFACAIAGLVLDTFRQRGVHLPALLDESRYTLGEPRLEVRWGHARAEPSA